MLFVFDGGAAEAGVEAAVVVGVFDAGVAPGADLVAGGDGISVVVLGCEGGPRGIGHGVIPARSGPTHRHGSFHRAHVGGQLFGGELCSPISMQHDPTGEAATGGSSHVERGDDQVGALLLTHGVSEHSVRVRIAHGAQVDPTLRVTQVGKVRDPHPIQGTLIPLVVAVVLMGHWGPTNAPDPARARVESCQAQAAH